MTFHPNYNLHQIYEYLSQATEGRLIGTPRRRELIESSKQALKALIMHEKGAEFRLHNTFLKLLAHTNNYEKHLNDALLKLRQSTPDLNGAEAEVMQAMDDGKKIKECVKFFAKNRSSL